LQAAASGGVNEGIFADARRHGCTAAEAEVLAHYVDSEKVSDAAEKIGIAEQTAKNHLNRVRRRLKVAHNAAVIARLRD
jgi:DNA-binding CsgD family transcriptional regulator